MQPTTLETIFAALTSAHLGTATLNEAGDLLTVKLQGASSFSAGFAIKGDKVIVRGWGGESSLKAGDKIGERAVTSVRRMLKSNVDFYASRAGV